MRADLPLERAAFVNGAWMPSIAEDVATERSTLRARASGSRRKRLVTARREPMPPVYGPYRASGRHLP